MNAPVVGLDGASFINPEAEEQVLGTLLLHNDSLHEVPWLEAEHFHEPLNRKIFEEISARVATGQPVTPVTILSGLPAIEGRDITTAQYVAHLAASATTIKFMPSTAREVVSLGERRRLNSVGVSLQTHAAAVPVLSPSEIVANAELELVGVSDRLARMNGEEDPTTVDTTLAKIRERMESGSHWIGPRCGLTQIDNLLGGFAPADFILLAGRPSMGKSAVGASMARSAARIGTGVAFDSIEMSLERIWHRILTDEAGDLAPSYKMAARGKITPDDFAGLERARDRLKRMPLRVMAGSSRLAEVPARIRSARRWLRARGSELQIYIIDYLGLLEPGDRYRGNKVNEVGEVSAVLKRLAKREGIAIVALHQLNRSSEGRDDNRPRMSDLRDSGNLEQDADIISFVHRESYYIERPGYRQFESEAARNEAAEKWKHVLELIVAKSRNTDTMTVRLWCDPATNQVRDLVP